MCEGGDRRMDAPGGDVADWGNAEVGVDLVLVLNLSPAMADEGEGRALPGLCW